MYLTSFPTEMDPTVPPINTWARPSIYLQGSRSGFSVAVFDDFAQLLYIVKDEAFTQESLNDMYIRNNVSASCGRCVTSAAGHLDVALAVVEGRPRAADAVGCGSPRV